jgi:hypothetical protein
MLPLAIKKIAVPIFSEILAYRPAALAVAGIGAAQLIGSSLGFGMPCAFYHATGKPCPGCGLTRSVLALLHGQVGHSFNLHPMGPLLLIGLLAALAAGIMPAKARQKWIGLIAALERRTGIVAILFVAMMVLWVLRVAGCLPLADLSATA